MQAALTNPPTLIKPLQSGVDWRGRKGDHSLMFTVTAKAFNPQTGRVDAPVTYQARTRQEALDWVRFNRDWMREFRIDGVRVSA